MALPKRPIASICNQLFSVRAGDTTATGREVIFSCSFLGFANDPRALLFFPAHPTSLERSSVPLVPVLSPPFESSPCSLASAAAAALLRMRDKRTKLVWHFAPPPAHSHWRAHWKKERKGVKTGQFFFVSYNR